MESGSGSVTDAITDVMRCIFFPRTVSLEAIDVQAFVVFMPTDKKSKVAPYVASFGALSLLPTLQDRHDYGCRSAILANEGIKERRALKGEHYSEADRQSYIGHYNLLHAALRDIKSNYYNIRVDIHPEKGEKAHCHVTLILRDDLDRSGTGFKDLISQERLNMRQKISTLLFGPEPYICKEDEDIRAALEQITLPKLPIATGG